MTAVSIDRVKWDPKIYPRAKWNTSTIDRYVDALEAGETFPRLVLEEGTDRLLDGKHRLEAHKKAGREEVDVEWHKVPKAVPAKLYAAGLSARHGDRLSSGDTKTLIREVYQDNPEFDQVDIVRLLGVSKQWVSANTSDILAKRREERRAKSLRLHRLGWAQSEIADRLGISQGTVSGDIKESSNGLLDSGHAPDEIALRMGWPVQLVHAIQSDGKTDAERLAKLGIKTQPYDVWQFASCHDLMGDAHPGRIPGELVAHVLYFYTQPGDLVVDPMAGSGTTLDACLLLGRKARGYDIDARHDRIDVEHHDLSEGWPDSVGRASLIFWDPPYFDKMDSTTIGDDGYIDGSVSKLDPDEYLAFFGKRFAELKSAVKPGTRLAFLMSDWDPENAKHHQNGRGIHLWDYADLLRDAGWTLNRQIQAPLSTQQVHPDIVNKFRESRRLARLERYLLIATA